MKADEVKRFFVIANDPMSDTHDELDKNGDVVYYSDFIAFAKEAEEEIAHYRMSGTGPWVLQTDYTALQSRLDEAVVALDALAHIPAVLAVLGREHVGKCTCPLCHANEIVSKAKAGGGR
jgi:hypothetical protein